MEKHYLFLSNKPIKKGIFLAALEGFGIESSLVNFYDDKSGEIVFDETLFPFIESLIHAMREDIGVSFSILVAYDKTPFMLKLLKEAVEYFPNQCLYPSDVIMKQMSFGDYSFLAQLKLMFASVPSILMLTAGEYLRCGLDASLASKALFIHRNTFNYRLAQFIEITKLDIRDYHNSLLLELYFQLCTTGSRQS